LQVRNIQLSREGFIQLYRAHGFSVIPLSSGSKIPLKGFDLDAYLKGDKRLSDEEVHRYFKDPHVNVGLILGQPSNNLTVLDFENLDDALAFQPDIEKVAEQTIVATTAHGGVHIYMQTDDQIGRTIKVCQDHFFDLLGKGLIVAPPSSIYHSRCEKHKPCGGKVYNSTYQVVRSYQIGENYQMVNNLAKSVLARCKVLEWKVNESIHPSRRLTEVKLEKILAGVRQGERNTAACTYSMYLLGKLKFDLDLAWHELQRWNESNKPPLNDTELVQIMESAAKKINERRNHYTTCHICNIEVESKATLDEHYCTIHPEVGANK